MLLGSAGASALKRRAESGAAKRGDQATGDDGASMFYCTRFYDAITMKFTALNKHPSYNGAAGAGVGGDDSTGGSAGSDEEESEWEAGANDSADEAGTGKSMCTHTRACKHARTRTYEHVFRERKEGKKKGNESHSRQCLVTALHPSPSLSRNTAATTRSLYADVRTFFLFLIVFFFLTAW